LAMQCVQTSPWAHRTQRALPQRTQNEGSAPRLPHWAQEVDRKGSLMGGMETQPRCRSVTARERVAGEGANDNSAARPGTRRVFECQSVRLARAAAPADRSDPAPV
jgi:hypothetical protein